MKKQILLVASLFILSTQGMAQAKIEKIDYFVGGDKKIVCAEDEADMVVKNLANEAGKDNFKDAIGFAIGKLNMSLWDLLFDKKISGRSLEDETADLVKKAACLTSVITKNKLKDDFKAMYKKNLLMVEGQTKINIAEMPSYEDASSIEEQNNAVNNEIFLANRGVIAFVLTMSYKE